MTFPYSLKAETEIKQSIRHIYEVRATHSSWSAPIVLDVISATLTYDEDGAPFCRASLTVKVPDTVAEIDALDPRIRVGIEIDAGYVYTGGVHEMHTIARLDLRERTIQRPANQMTLVAEGYESRLSDTYSVSLPKTYTASSDAGTSLKELIEWHAPGSAPVSNRLSARTFLTGTDVITEELGGDPLNLLRDITDRAGAWTYYNGVDAWIIQDDAAVAGKTAHFASVGNNGTLTASESMLSRNSFFNTVMVKHRWDDPVTGQQEVMGWAAVTTGAYGVPTIGRKGIVVEREYKGSAATAKAAASAMLKRGVSRGRQVSIESATSAFWLRPGMTIQVQLKTGAAERHLVTSVDFDIPVGTMHISTRLPEDVVITTGE